MQGECRACPCAKARTPGPNPSLSWADWGQSSIGESPVCRHGTQSLSPHEERLPCHLICSSTGWGRGGPGDRALCCEVQEEIGLCGAKIQTWEQPRHAPSTSGPHETQAWNPWACDFSGGLSRGRVHRCPLKLRWGSGVSSGRCDVFLPFKSYSTRVRPVLNTWWRVSYFLMLQKAC